MTKHLHNRDCFHLIMIWKKSGEKTCASVVGAADSEMKWKVFATSLSKRSGMKISMKISAPSTTWTNFPPTELVVRRRRRWPRIRPLSRKEKMISSGFAFCRVDTFPRPGPFRPERRYDGNEYDTMSFQGCFNPQGRRFRTFYLSISIRNVVRPHNRRGWTFSYQVWKVGFSNISLQKLERFRPKTLTARSYRGKESLLRKNSFSCFA